MCDCSAEIETTSHFFLRCQFFANERQNLHERLYLIHPSIKKLYEELNKEILLCTIYYIKSSKRFERSFLTCVNIFFFYFSSYFLLFLPKCHLYLPLRKNRPYSELFWSAFSRIQTEYEEIRSISPYSVRMLENSDQNNSNFFLTFFMQCTSPIQPFKLNQSGFLFTFCSECLLSLICAGFQ